MRDFRSIVSSLSWLCFIVCVTGNDEFESQFLKPSSGAVELTLNDRELLKLNPKAKEILNEHRAFSAKEQLVKNFKSHTLAYVTPWNNHGYDVAKMFAKKFTHISPVWLQIKLNQDDSTTRIEGKHDIDAGWIADLRQANPDIKIVPRVIFDSWMHSELLALLTNPRLPSQIGKQLSELALEYGFDGFTIEIWSSFATQQKLELAEILIKIAAHFKKHKLELILVVPPPLHHGDQVGIFVREDLERLAPYVTFFSVMTYDYSNMYRPGPNSPIQWIRKCVEALVPNSKSPNRAKLLVGMNFYGNNYTPNGGRAIVGHEFLDILNKHKPKIIWDDIHEEHFVEYKSHMGRNRAFFPTLMSIKKRLQLLEQLGTGISIWEIGQGLDYFFEMF